MINLAEVTELLDNSTQKVKGMYRIIFNGNWVYGKNKALFWTVKAAKTSLSLEIGWTICDFLCKKQLGAGLYELRQHPQYRGKYNEKSFKKEAKEIIAQLIKNGTIVIEEIK